MKLNIPMLRSYRKIKNKTPLECTTFKNTVPRPYDK